MLISDVVKLLVSRPRPPVEHLQAVTGSSFPSGHATQASAFWFSLVLGAARAAARRAMLTGARRCGRGACSSWRSRLSRVYLGVHYPARRDRRRPARDRLGGVRRALRAGDAVSGTIEVAHGSGRVQHLDHRLMRRSVAVALAGAGPHAGRDHAGRELLPTVASHRGALAAVRGPAGAKGRRARPHRDRDRGGGGERARQAARAPAPSLPALAADAHPHAALDVVSLRSQRRRVRVRHRRLRRAAGHSRRCSSRWPAPSPTRACTPAFTTRATSRPAPRSGSAPAFSPRACAWVANDERSERSAMSARATGRALGAGRSRRAHLSALVAASGSGRRGGAGRDPRSAGHGLRASWPGCRRSPGSTRRSPAWSATRCSGPRGCWCSAPTPRSRR